MMKPTNKIKKTIILSIDPGDRDPVIGSAPLLETDEDVRETYSKLDDEDICQDYEQDYRHGEVSTGLECEWSRHYDSKAVAAKMFDGSWVGWTCWYGGGKHGEPESIEWMADAYDLECEEEEKMTIIRTFKKHE